MARSRCKARPLHSADARRVQLQSSPGCGHKAHRTHSSTRVQGTFLCITAGRSTILSMNPTWWNSTVLRTFRNDGTCRCLPSCTSITRSRYWVRRSLHRLPYFPDGSYLAGQHDFQIADPFDVVNMWDLLTQQAPVAASQKGRPPRPCQ